MSSQRFAPEFKDEAVRQIVERSHPVSEVAQRLGVERGIKLQRGDCCAPQLLGAKYQIKACRTVRDLLSSGIR